MNKIVTEAQIKQVAAGKEVGDGMKDGEWFSQSTFMLNPGTWTTTQGLAWGGKKGGMDGGREREKNGGNHCNSIKKLIN